MCAVCNHLHGVQLHHITPRNEGGSDDISNAIPLCPNCHDATHAQYGAGRTTRAYTEHELRKHLARTVELAARQASLRPGGEDWQHDLDLLKFYAVCLDRPAFRTLFHNELSFADFDQALEDTVLALNTGLRRTRDGTLIEQAEGKRAVVNPAWRDALDIVVSETMQARHALRRGLGLDRMILQLDWLGDPLHHFQHTDGGLGANIDGHRQAAINAMNAVLEDARLPLLKHVGDWS